MKNLVHKSNISKASSFLSGERAKQFVAEKLAIDNFAKKFRNDKISLLNEIISAWQNKIPFQTASNLASAADVSDRRIPPMEEVISSVLSLRGGSCWTLNAGMHMLLNALGFEVILGLGGVFNPNADNHAMVFVKNLIAPGSSHIVEVGFASVSPNAISLDFDKESKVIDGIYTPQKYIKYGEWFVRCHKSTPGGLFDLKIPVTKIHGWDLVCYFKVEEHSFNDVQQAIDIAYFSKPDSFLNRDIMITALQHGKFVFLYNRKLKLEKSPGGKVQIVMLEKDEQLLDAIFQYFPSMKSKEVKNAVLHWNNQLK